MWDSQFALTDNILYMKQNSGCIYIFLQKSVLQNEELPAQQHYLFREEKVLRN